MQRKREAGGPDVSRFFIDMQDHPQIVQKMDLL